ncbi:MAG: hypothetical protein VKN33_10270 [Candidatus Sericytochromatia bacterium]|nr:hypothetical protein [Candidatus Sericytochromatia bacterium]
MSVFRYTLPIVCSAVLFACGVEPAGTQPKPQVNTSQDLLAVQRLSGRVVFLDESRPGAVVKAYDLLTGQEVSLISAGGQNLISAGGQNLITAGGQNLIRTDDQGYFEAFVPLADVGDVLKLVAQTEGGALVSFVAPQGPVLGASWLPGRYALRQASSTGTGVRVEITPATTVLAKSFEGALKLQFERPQAERAEAIERVIESANKTFDRVAESLRDNPATARDLVSALDEQGNLRDISAFQRAVTRIGVIEELVTQVEQIVSEVKRTVTESSDRDKRPQNRPVRRDDFPLGAVEVTDKGEVTILHPSKKNDVTPAAGIAKTSESPIKGAAAPRAEGEGRSSDARGNSNAAETKLPASETGTKKEPESGASTGGGSAADSSSVEIGPVNPSRDVARDGTSTTKDESAQRENENGASTEAKGGGVPTSRAQTGESGSTKTSQEPVERSSAGGNGGDERRAGPETAASRNQG